MKAPIIEKEYWTIAKTILHSASDGSFLPYTVLPSTLQYREKYIDFAQLYKLPFSFFKMDGVIYLKDHLTLKGNIGNYGTIKYIYKENGEREVVKIETTNDSYQKEETLTLIDKKISTGKIVKPIFNVLTYIPLGEDTPVTISWTRETKKYYTVMKDLGVPADLNLPGYKLNLTTKQQLDALKKYSFNTLYVYPDKHNLVCEYFNNQGESEIKRFSPQEFGEYSQEVVNFFNNPGDTLSEQLINCLYYKTKLTPFSEKKRLALSIQAGQKLVDSHNGSDTESGERYKHGDIKLANMTIDPDGILHLIDWGFSEKYLYGINTSLACTQVNGPYFPLHEKGLPKDKVDLLAFKRGIIYMPPTLYCFEGFVDVSDWNDPCILDIEILNKYGLRPYFDTGSTEIERQDHADSDLNALTLTAILIIAYLDLSPSYYEELRKDRRKSLIVNEYYKQNASKETIEKIFQGTDQLGLLAACIEMKNLHKRQEYLSDDAFNNRVEKAKSHEEACVLIYLKENKLESLFEAVQDCEIANAVFLLIRDRLPINKIKKVINNKSFATTINLLNQCDLPEYFIPALLNSTKQREYESFCATIKNSKSHFETCVLIYLKENHLEIFFNKVHKTPELIKALFILIKYKITKQEAINIINNESLAQIIIQLEDFGLEEYSSLVLDNFNNDFFCRLQQIKSEEEMHVLLVLKSSEINDLYNIIQSNPEIAAAASTLLKNEFSIKKIRAVIKNDYLIKIVNFLHQFKLSKFYNTVLYNEKIAKGIFILIDAPIDDKCKENLIKKILMINQPASEMLSIVYYLYEKKLLTYLINLDAYFNQKYVPGLTISFNEKIFMVINTLALVPNKDKVSRDMLTNKIFIEVFYAFYNKNYASINYVENVVLLYQNQLLNENSIKIIHYLARIGLLKYATHALEDPSNVQLNALMKNHDLSYNEQQQQTKQLLQQYNPTYNLFIPQPNSEVKKLDTKNTLSII